MRPQTMSTNIEEAIGWHDWYQCIVSHETIREKQIIKREGERDIEKKTNYSPRSINNFLPANLEI